MGGIGGELGSIYGEFLGEGDAGSGEKAVDSGACEFGGNAGEAGSTGEAGAVAGDGCGMMRKTRQEPIQLSQKI